MINETLLLICLVLIFFLGRYNLKKLTYDERKARLIERLNLLNSAAADDNDDDE